MSKRNFILLIVLMIILLLVVFSIMYRKKPPTDTVVETNTDTNFLTNFWPFKSKNTNSNSPNSENPENISNNGDNNQTENTTGKQLILKKVSSVPIAGYTVFIKESFINVPTIIPDPNREQVVSNSDTTAPSTENLIALRYTDKANGNTYQTLAEEINERKITDTLVPQVHESFFANNGSSVIMRYLKKDRETITSFTGTLPLDILGGDVNDTKIKGSFLPDNIKDMSIAPDGSQLFYLSDLGDNIVGIKSTPSGTNKTQIFESPFTEWLSSWPNKDIITLTTKPSSQVIGYSYALDTNTKKFTKLIGGINGLTTLTSPDGKLVLYSNNNMSLNVYNTDTKESRELNIRTLPEKCTWSIDNITLYCAVPKSPSGSSYPDIWYQGEVSFYDRIWVINIKNYSEEIIIDPALSMNGEEVDGIKLSLDVNENYLFFINKKDSYLWELKLK